jgi:AGZA family xanthine/uracil permease-like MFS transporter
MLPAVLGFLAMVALDARKVPGAIIIGILALSFIGIALGLNKFGGFVSWPLDRTGLPEVGRRQGP